MMIFFKKKEEKLTFENDVLKITIEGKNHPLKDLQCVDMFYEQDGKKYLAFDGIFIEDGKGWFMWRGHKTLVINFSDSFFMSGQCLNITGIEGRALLSEK